MRARVSKSTAAISMGDEVRHAKDDTRGIVAWESEGSAAVLWSGFIEPVEYPVADLRLVREARERIPQLRSVAYHWLTEANA